MTSGFDYNVGVFMQAQKQKNREEETLKEKKLKAFDIIKDRIIWVENGKIVAGRPCDAELIIDKEDIDVTQEEYDLLKEVLRDE